MRVTPCSSCGDKESPLAIQAGRVALCVSCTRAIPAWFFAAGDAEVEAFFGYPIRDRRMQLARIADAAVHTDLATAYRAQKLDADATIEWALAATIAGDPHEPIARLLEPIVARGTLQAMARAVGLYLTARRSTAS